MTLVTMGTATRRSAFAARWPWARPMRCILDDAVAGSDTLGTAKILAAAIKKQPFDLVICGTESSDSYSGIVPGQVAHFLGVPAVTFAKEVAVDGNKLTIKRQSESGYDVVEALLPALCFHERINEPRYPQLKDHGGEEEGNQNLHRADSEQAGSDRRVRRQGKVLTVSPRRRINSLPTKGRAETGRRLSR